jgi:peptidoglycan/LPS O-acetylase OafA/YrhL
LIGHSSPIAGLSPLGGEEAVETFFMISGFYMAMILHEKYTGKGSYKLFISNRFLRIYPTYWCFLILAVAMWLLSPPALRAMGPTRIYHMHFGWPALALMHFSNLFLFGQDAVLFFTTNPAGHLQFTRDFLHSDPELSKLLFIPPAWSLSVELTFYLIAPFLMRKKSATLALLIAIGLALRIYMHQSLGLTNDPWTYRFFPTELPLFLAGALAYRAYRWIRLVNLPKSLDWTMLGLVLIAYFAYQFVGLNLRVKQWSFYTIALLALPFVFRATSKFKLDRAIGELSFPVYLSHAVVYEYLAFRGNGAGIHVLVASLGISILVTQILVRPMEKWRQSRVRAAHAPVHPAEPPAEPKLAIAA